MKRNIVVTIIGVAWFVAVCLGIKMIWDYAALAGESAVPPDRWPAECRIEPASDRATLVLLAHPKCPCTRATIRELALLMAQSKGRVTAYVAFYKPEGFDDKWEHTDLWDAASEIPDVTVLSDESGSLAATFKAATSGQAVLYDSNGQLLFAGGITSARGHSGDNPGRAAIVSMLANQTEEQVETPVFGCPLFNRDSDCQQGVHQ